MKEYIRRWLIVAELCSMNSRGGTLVVVNGAHVSGLAERGAWVLRASGQGRVVCREAGRVSAIKAFLAGARDLRPCTVYAIDCAVATVILGLIARSLWRSRVVIDSGDATAALVRSTGTGGYAGFVGAKILERVGYTMSETIVVRSRGLAEHVKATSGRDTVIIPDGFDPVKISPRNGEEFRKEWGADDDALIVGVLGSARWNARLQWCYGRDVVEAVGLTRRRDVVGVIIASGNGLPYLRRLAQRRGVGDRIRFVEPGTGESLLRQLGAVDVALSTQTNDVVGQCRTTGKLVLYLATGKYILASRVGTAAELLPPEMLIDYEGGWDEGYFRRLAERLDALPARTELAKRGRALLPLSSQFAYPSLLKIWKEKVFSDWRDST